jgi:hypothetical protein
MLNMPRMLVHVATVRRHSVCGPLMMPRRDNDWIGRLFDGFLVGILTAASALVIFYVVFRGVI